MFSYVKGQVSADNKGPNNWIHAVLGIQRFHLFAHDMQINHKTKTNTV
jgi:hypothetical protein